MYMTIVFIAIFINVVVTVDSSNLFDMHYMNEFYSIKKNVIVSCETLIIEVETIKLIASK